jgi:hypothetical protein
MKGKKISTKTKKVEGRERNLPFLPRTLVDLHHRLRLRNRCELLAALKVLINT